MKFGIVLPNFGLDATHQTILATAQAAEALGFDSIWVTDHLALPVEDSDRFGHIFEALSTLSWLAAKTERVHLGISTLVLPQRNPVEIAKSLATLDNLSRGRVIFTAGIGWSAGEYHNLGYEFSNRARRMDEALTLIRLLWGSSAPASFSGKYYHFDGLVLSPLPVQAGGIPILVAGDSPAALNRAVKYGDGWHPNSKPLTEFSILLQSVKAQLEGRDFEICMRMRVAFTSEPLPEAVLSGSPHHMRQMLTEYHRTGVTSVILYFPSETQNARERAMETFQQEVIADFDSC